jgi:lipoprotein-anchoring transpeptidase ErfK/SrfK
VGLGLSTCAAKVVKLANIKPDALGLGRAGQAAQCRYVDEPHLISAIHGTTIRARLSHGYIPMYDSDIWDLYGCVSLGTEVVVLYQRGSIGGLT